jgi:hypothetical protein
MFRCLTPNLRKTQRSLKGKGVGQSCSKKNRYTVYFQNCMKSLNTLCGQNEELLTLKAGGT